MKIRKEKSKLKAIAVIRLNLSNVESFQYCNHYEQNLVFIKYSETTSIFNDSASIIAREKYQIKFCM